VALPWYRDAFPPQLRVRPVAPCSLSLSIFSLLHFRGPVPGLLSVGFRHEFSLLCLAVPAITLPVVYASIEIHPYHPLLRRRLRSFSCTVRLVLCLGGTGCIHSRRATLVCLAFRLRSRGCLGTGGFIRMASSDFVFNLVIR